jgi:hypothetical protein
MSRIVASVVLLISMVGCSAGTVDKAVSGPSWCMGMTETHRLELTRRKTLESYRELREYYADCSTNFGVKRQAHLLAAARGAAALGDEQDKQDYASWQMSFSEPAEQSHAR